MAHCSGSWLHVAMMQNIADTLGVSEKRIAKVQKVNWGCHVTGSQESIIGMKRTFVAVTFL